MKIRRKIRRKSFLNIYIFNKHFCIDLIFIKNLFILSLLCFFALNIIMYFFPDLKYMDVDTIYYYTDNGYIESDEGKIYIDSFYIHQMDKEVDNYEMIFNIFIEQIDLKEHNIEFYLYQDDEKYELKSFYFKSSNIENISEIFRKKGLLSFEAYFKKDTGIRNFNDIYSFDRLSIKVDDKYFDFNLIKVCSDSSKISFFPEKYNISDKIVTDDSNVFYIDNFEIFSGLSSNINLKFSNVIQNYSVQNLNIYLKDSDNLLYRLFLKKDIEDYNYLAKENLNSVYLKFKVFASKRDYTHLVFEVNDVLYEVPITKKQFFYNFLF